MMATAEKKINLLQKRIASLRRSSAIRKNREIEAAKELYRERKGYKVAHWFSRSDDYRAIMKRYRRRERHYRKVLRDETLEILEEGDDLPLTGCSRVITAVPHWIGVSAAMAEVTAAMRRDLELIVRVDFIGVPGVTDIGYDDEVGTVWFMPRTQEFELRNHLGIIYSACSQLQESEGVYFFVDLEICRIKGRVLDSQPSHVATITVYPGTRKG